MRVMVHVGRGATSSGGGIVVTSWGVASDSSGVCKGGIVHGVGLLWLCVGGGHGAACRRLLMLVLVWLLMVCVVHRVASYIITAATSAAATTCIGPTRLLLHSFPHLWQTHTRRR